MKKYLFLLAIMFTAAWGFSQPVLDLTSPNGGEVWQSGSTYNITWTCTGGCGPTVNINLTTNGGMSWNTIASGVPNTGTYSWTIPPMFTMPSPICLIQVTDGMLMDQSMSFFQISHPSMTVVAPNGGQTLISGQTYTITVSSTNTFGGSLDYSTNGGITWNNITASLSGFPGTVNYTWTVPTITPAYSAYCLIRFNSGGPFADFSDSYFTITNTIDVTSPNGGEVLPALGSHTITWNNTPGVTSVLIQYSTDNGVNWTTINAMAPTGPSGGSYTWSPIPATPSATCLVRVMDGMIPFIGDTSNANFTITSGTATVTAPNGGETWYVGSTQNITWTYTGPPSQYDIEYSTDNGATWNLVATNVSVGSFGGSYAWLIPNTPSNQCLVRVTDMFDPTRTDVSNAVFTIAAPTITVVSPNGGESWLIGSTQTISWTSMGPITAVDIFYSTDNGTNWTNIVTNHPNGTGGGTYSWTVPNTPSNQCLVRVSDFMLPSINDVSNANFTITSGTATVTAPNGGETWYVGSTQNITWTYTGPPSQYDIEYSTDNGATWNLVATNVSVGAGGGSYAWVIPNTPSNQCLVRVTDMNDPTRTDVSNAVFTIAAPTITVVSPNGGESWLIGSTQTISWNSTGPITQVMIEYTTDGGSTWNYIAGPIPNGTGGGTYSWTVPNTPSNQCLVRVSDFMLPSINDVSNANFTITSGTATVTAPNGGETWYVGSTQNITWTYTGPPSQYDIEYSTDNGATWNLVATNVSVGVGGGSHAWVIPNTPSNQCLVRVTDMIDPTRTDVSDAVFTIALPSITVTDPNGFENWVVGSSQTISWTSMGPITAVDIFYSTDNGTNWTNIVTNHPNGTGGGTYSWTVPNTPSNQCLVRVSDFMMPTIVDQSDAVFTISANVPRSLTVVAPNGGESFTPGSSTNISWTFTGGVNQILIEYTTDNGLNWTTIATVPVTSSPYSWTVPNTPGNLCVVKITDVDSSYVMDMSDAHFEIQSLGMISLNEVSIKVYPNPVTDFLIIQNNLDAPVQAEVYSLDGKLIYQTELLQANTTIPMQAHKPGIYLVRIQNKVFKVTKQ